MKPNNFSIFKRTASAPYEEPGDSSPDPSGKKARFFNKLPGSIKKKCNNILVLSLSMLLFNCGSGTDAYKVEEIDGARFVHNLTPKWGDKPQVELEFVKQIGDVDAEEDGHYVFNRLRQIGKDGSGNFYVLDGKNFRIVKFDRNWRYLLEFGRKGQGPGEFSMFTFDMDVDKAGNVYVLDYMQRRVEIFAASGKVSGGFKLPGKRAMYLRVLSSGNMVKKNTIDKEEDKSLLTIVNKEGKVQSRFGTVFPPQGQIEVGYINDARLDVDGSDNIYVTFLFENRIEKYSPQGKLLLVVDRALNYKIDHKMVKPEGIDRYYPEMTMVSQDIAVDAKGRIWNLTFTAQPEDKGSASSWLKDHSIVHLEIFDKEGVLLGSLPTPKHVNRIRIFGDRLFLVDTYEGMCVYEYKIFTDFH
ncbi:MAG: hypothetical protein KAW12_30540 [Candidatus Aminicenantes bacterium]|nr:hypothetical protein [Candidatus Aminicenantes bacterium]